MEKTPCHRTQEPEIVDSRASVQAEKVDSETIHIQWTYRGNLTPKRCEELARLIGQAVARELRGEIVETNGDQEPS